MEEMQNKLTMRAQEPRWFSEYGLQASSIDITCNLVRHENSPGPVPDPLNQEPWGWAPAIGVLICSPGKCETFFHRERGGGTSGVVELPGGRNDLRVRQLGVT